MLNSPSTLLAFHTPAFILPDFIRKGYNSCSSCYVSPAGGGILTNYGRCYTEAMIRWALDGQDSFLMIPATALTSAPLGFSQGHETLNMQVHFENDLLIFLAAKTLGEDVLLSAGEGGLQYRDSSARERLILRVPIFPEKRSRQSREPFDDSPLDIKGHPWQRNPGH